MQRVIDTIVLVVLGSCGLALTWMNWDTGGARHRAWSWLAPDRRPTSEAPVYVYIPPAVFVPDAGAPLARPTVDGRGRLLQTGITRTYIETQMLQDPNESDQHVRDRLITVFLHEAPASPPAETTALVDHYVRYRRESRTLAAEHAAGKSSSRFADALEQLRSRIFGEHAAKLFADATTDVILDDPSLSLTVREARIRAVMGGGALSLQEARKIEVDVAALNHQEAQLRKEGGTANQFMRLRTRMVGADAAQRLAKLDAPQPP